MHHFSNIIGSCNKWRAHRNCVTSGSDQNASVITLSKYTERPCSWPTARALSVFRECYDRGVLIRTTGDTIAMCPPFIATADDIRKVVHTVKESLEAIE